ncbi:Kinesin-like protein KIF25 [Trichoplax sp. H2]|nr:Kinesin-like protein KIF25 [Trichoplax sp. H2]|eukprot:RDD41994.1 Kinesin-like protein KIF25 [Trichoplax sp. H2]
MMMPLDLSAVNSPCDDVFIDKTTHFAKSKNLARAKQEKILALETENAMLYLKLAKCQSQIRELNSQIAHQRRITESKEKNVNQTIQSLKQFYDELKDMRQSYSTLKQDVANIPVQMDDNITQILSASKAYGQKLITKSREKYLALKDIVSKVDNLDILAKQYKELYEKEKEKRKMLHNTLVELRGNIRVHCRIRPVLPIDDEYTDDPSKVKSGPKEQVIDWIDEETIMVKNPRFNADKTYEYERVFAQSDPQEAVFNDVAPLLTSLLDGYNVCIMAYGQTGSGKTHTMLGGHASFDNNDWIDIELPHAQEGVIPRAARELFRLIGEENQKHPHNFHSLEISVAEVYNNSVRDLLNIGRKDSSDTRYLEIVTSADGSHDVPSLITKPVSNVSDVMAAVMYGMRHRHEDATLVHSHSSRSHLIVTVTITTTINDSQSLQQIKTRKKSAESRTSQIPLSPGIHLQTTSRRSQSVHYSPLRLASTPSFGSLKTVVKTKLQLVDLAGSECVGMSGVTGSALRETRHINRSLSALADVLGALAENRTHVPYRNSKLTQMLQDSIGGDAKLLVFLCVSPMKRHLTESMQCLGFGSRARQIQRGAVKQRKSHILAGTSGGSSSSEETSSAVGPIPIAHNKRATRLKRNFSVN